MQNPSAAGMIVFLNGEFVPASRARVSVFDRCFLYGDGLFETVRVHNGKPFHWTQHVERLRSGAKFLKLRLPVSPADLHRFAGQLIHRNRMRDALLRLQVSRGAGIRGYSARGANLPVVVMSLHEAPRLDPKKPPCWRLATSTIRLPAGDAVAQYKTCSKLAQILARAEADAQGADEALLLNTRGEAAEGAGSNLFWIEGNRVCTTPLSSGVLAGVTRSVVQELCRDLGLPTRERDIKVAALRKADGVFLSLTSRGIVEAVGLDDRTLRRSSLVQILHVAYVEKLKRECSGKRNDSRHRLRHGLRQKRNTSR